MQAHSNSPSSGLLPGLTWSGETKTALGDFISWYKKRGGGSRRKNGTQNVAPKTCCFLWGGGDSTAEQREVQMANAPPHTHCRTLQKFPESPRHLSHWLCGVSRVIMRNASVLMTLPKKEGNIRPLMNKRKNVNGRPRLSPELKHAKTGVRKVSVDKETSHLQTTYQHVSLG